jgi:class 3 adenylate cyclase/tetratricopeptide (TPR) repeat protein
VVEPALAALRGQLAALEAQPQPSQQRKQATILFADVSGFTTLSETMDAEVVAEVMNDLWAGVDQVILDHGGRIDKHIGDAVMAVWGAEAAREDDPERAVRAALAMQAAIDAFCASHHAPLAMRVGVNTGAVLLGQVGTMGEFTALGDAVNLASRLEQAAPVGGVLISHDTYRHVRGVFDVQPRPELQLKGKTEPQQAYVVLRAKPRSFRMATRGVEGIETRTVGRDAELLALQNAYVDSLEESEARIVLVTGEAGVGKSRLLYEFENWLEWRPERISFHKGRAIPASQRTRLGLFRNQYAMRFDILESDPAEAALEKFRRGMAPALDADQADVVGHWLGFDFSASPAVAQLAGRPEFGIAAQAHLIRYLRHILRDRPVVMFFEDIHWADDASLELILDLATTLPECRFLIVCPARPVFFERRPGWGEGHPAVQRLELKPLSRRFTRELVDEILQRVPTVPDELRDVLVDNAEGNPFYVEELVKMLIDEGVIAPDDGPADGAADDNPWRVDAGRLRELRVPATLTGVLQARLDSLPPPERDILQRSAVVGRLFWDGTVAELAGRAATDIRPIFDVLRDRELILRRGRSSFAGVEEYAFHHNLLREVVYETVLLRSRRQYHAQVASWIEAHAGERLDEFLSLIAEHFALAGQNERAATYFERVGLQAWNTGTYRAARAAYEHALALRRAAGDPENISVEAQIFFGATMWQLGDYAAARRHLESGLAAARGSADGHAEILGLYYLGQTLGSLGDYPGSQACFEEALPVARGLGGKDLAQILSGLGGNAWRIGDLDRAETYINESLILARAERAVSLETQATNTLGLIAGSRNDIDTEQQCYERCLDLARQIGDLFREATALANLGVIAIVRESYLEAKRYLEACLEMFNDLGRLESVSLNLGNLAHVYQKLGDFDTARRHTREMLRLARQLGATPRVLDGLLNWAEMDITTGDTAGGLALIGLIRHHPAHEYQMEQEVARVIGLAGLDETATTAALVVGERLNLDTVVDEILTGGQ